MYWYIAGYDDSRRMVGVSIVARLIKRGMNGHSLKGVLTKSVERTL
jgi:hypothetical protein